MSVQHKLQLVNGKCKIDLVVVKSVGNGFVYITSALVGVAPTFREEDKKS